MLGEILIIDNCLPLGFSTSSLMANLICYNLDNDFMELCEKKELIYTRYADDISISNYNNSELLEKDTIICILQKYQFELEENKYYITKLGQSHFVTGLSVSDEKKPHVPKKLKHYLRQQLYYIQKYGIYDVCQRLFQRCGIEHYHYIRIVKYITYIEKQNHYKYKWKKLYDRPIYFSPQFKYSGCNFNIFIDESEITFFPNTKGMMLGIKYDL